MNETNNGDTQGSTIIKIGMIICCAVILLPVVILLSADAGLGDLSDNWGVFLPLLICLGMHVVMHKMIGKSCHGDHENREPKRDQDVL